MNHKILEKFNLTKDEEQFIKESNTATTAHMNFSRVVSELYLSKTLEKITTDIIESNKKLSESNERYAKGMLYLTAALVFVGLVQVLTSFF